MAATNGWLCLLAFLAVVVLHTSADEIHKRGKLPTCCKRKLVTSTKIVTYSAAAGTEVYYTSARRRRPPGGYTKVTKTRTKYATRYRTEVVPAPSCPRSDLVCCSGHLSFDGNCVELDDTKVLTDAIKVVQKHHPDWSIQQINNYLSGIGRKRAVIDGFIAPNCKEYRPTTTTQTLTYYKMTPYTYYTSKKFRMSYRSVSKTGSRSAGFPGVFTVAPMTCDQKIGGKCLLTNKAHTQTASMKRTGSRATGYKKVKHGMCIRGKGCKYSNDPTGYETYYYTDKKTITTNPVGALICCGGRYNFRGICIEPSQKAVYTDIYNLVKAGCPKCTASQLNEKIGKLG